MVKNLLQNNNLRVEIIQCPFTLSLLNLPDVVDEIDDVLDGFSEPLPTNQRLRHEDSAKNSAVDEKQTRN